MSETTFENAKVGDRVWSIRKGWGTIDNIDNSKYPIDVKFDSGGSNSFLMNGKDYEQDAVQSLFWSEIPITPPPRPKRMVTKTVVRLGVIRQNGRFITTYDIDEYVKAKEIHPDCLIVKMESEPFEVEE